MEFIIDKILTKDIIAKKFSFDNPSLTNITLKKNDKLVKMSSTHEEVVVYVGEDRGTFYKISKEDWENNSI